MSTKEWKEIVNGWGLRKIDRGCCSWCYDEGVVYTDQPEPPTDSRARYERGMARIRARSWCRVHAEAMFKD